MHIKNYFFSFYELLTWKNLRYYFIPRNNIYIYLYKYLGTEYIMCQAIQYLVLQAENSQLTIL